METIYAIYNENFAKFSEQYSLDIIVQQLIEEEFLHNERHYSSEEFLEYHAGFYEALAPIYIKAKVTQLDVEDIQDLINKFNEHYDYDSENQLHLKTYLVPEDKVAHFTTILSDIGIRKFEALREIKSMN